MLNSDQFQGLLQSGAFLYLAGLIGFIALLIILGLRKKRRADKSPPPLTQGESAAQSAQDHEILLEKQSDQTPELRQTSQQAYQEQHSQPKTTDQVASAQEQSSLPDEEEHVIRADTVTKQRFPDKAEALKRDGQQAFDENNFAQAQESFDALLSLAHAYSEGNGAKASDSVEVELYEADARYYLGLIAQQENDLTLACENWQLARSLYEKHDAQDRFKKVEKNMIDAQCPTDWFLNNF